MDKQSLDILEQELIEARALENNIKKLKNWLQDLGDGSSLNLEWSISIEASYTNKDRNGTYAWTTNLEDYTFEDIEFKEDLVNILINELERVEWEFDML